MSQAQTRRIAPPFSGYAVRLLAGVKTAFRACCHRYAAAGIAAASHRETVIKRDLAYLDRNQLRDIGLDRDAM